MKDGTSGPAIETSGLVKVFGGTRAVDGVDLTVPAGTVYGVLGPNGAGKTTTVKMLATLLRPDGGEARVFGHDVLHEADAVRGRVSLTGQYASVDEDLTGTENLVLLGRLLGHRAPAARRRAARLLEAFGLAEAASRQVKSYSGGMRRRLDIAASILNTPDLLFLDEPTTGLDPRSRNQVWDIVRAVVSRGTTVLLTTQYLDEADRLASRIAVIDSGRVIAEGTKGELKASVGAGAVHVRLRDAGRRAEAGGLLARVLDARVQTDPDPVALTVRVGRRGDGAEAAEQASRALAELTRAGITVDTFSLGQPSLDEVFLALTDRPAPRATPADRQEAPA
ncbi:ATP-binding cassette domain-containing protein [Streptomyces sp. URMC 125]|uniref:ATP-binding cassette domain-containing protein n=1 Tax=Streptomyces sp. URMC 125 TaxID=3423419 RepID=UPI003F197A43